MTRTPDDLIIRWPDDHVDQMNILTIWSDDQMTMWPYDQMTKRPDDQMTRWPYWPYWSDDHFGQMTRWPDDRITSFTTHQNASLEPQKLAGHLPYQKQWWHMTIMMYWNINKNNSNPLPLKASPEPPKLARHLPYQIQWWYMMIWPYWCKETSSETTGTITSKKRHQSPQNWHVISHNRYNDDIWWSDHTHL